MATLRVSQLGHHYGAGPIFTSIDTEFETGKFYALIGPNGTGKSTMLRLLMGLEDPREGQVFIDGHDITSAHVLNRFKFTYVAESIDYKLKMRLDRFAARYSTLFDSWDQKYFEKLQEYLSFDLKRQFSSLSRGQKMQFALVLALASNPDFLFIDEITSVLDIEAREFFMNEIVKQARRGSCVLFATNIMSEVELLADEIVVISEQRIAVKDNFDNLKVSYRLLELPRESNLSILQHSDCRYFGLSLKGDKQYMMPVKLISESSAALEQYILDIPISLTHVFKYFFHREQRVLHEAA